MAIIKCKMCGGDLDINESITVGTCKYCGSTMTLPSKTDEMIVNLYNRANHFRRNNEFDKAAGVYESILNQDTSEAEAYWGLVLCKYGIEYVEDPETHKLVPTCHRTQFGSILTDADYQEALEHADAAAQTLYEAEAQVIDGIQKKILEISSKEEPFDVFICYKEDSEAGTRTPDSVLAQDLYYQLKGEGFKVFFSRITLEDKLGSAYEPYIFAALNSARVMVVIATKPDYVNSVWVKNEWKRYLSLIEKGEKKTLIPAYRDMDPYDLPEEFLHLQAQDMSKLGFMQDLLHGIKKLVAGANEKVPVNETVNNESYNPTATPLLDRAFLCLEDGDFNKADSLLEQVLNLDPRNAKAYIGKLMVAYQIREESQLGSLSKNFSENNDYQKALRFADEQYRGVLEGYNQSVLDRIETARKEEIYQKGLEDMNSPYSNILYPQIAAQFRSISGYKDSDKLAEECELVVEKDYLKAMEFKSMGSFSDAIEYFTRTGDYADAEEQIKESNYFYAMELKRACLFSDAIEYFTRAGDYADAKGKIKESYYDAGNALLDQGKIAEAVGLLMRVGDYNDASMKIKQNITFFKGRVSGGTFNTFGLKANGTVLAVGSNYYGALNVSGWRYIIAISAGSTHTLGLKLDRTVLAEGDVSWGQLNVWRWKDIIAIAAGRVHSVGLKSDGTVIAVGANESGQKKVRNWKEIIAIAAGGDQTFGLKTDGTVLAVGDNEYGQLNVSGWKDIVAIAARDYHTVGLKEDGTVIAVGRNDNGQTDVSIWKDIIAISAGSYHTVGLKTDGTVVAVGNNSDGQNDVSEWKDIIAISAGKSHTVGLKEDGTVVAVGSNYENSLNVSDWNLFK